MTAPNIEEVNKLREALRVLGSAKLELSEEIEALRVEKSEVETDQIQRLEQLERGFTVAQGLIEQLTDRVQQTASDESLEELKGLVRENSDLEADQMQRLEQLEHGSTVAQGLIEQLTDRVQQTASEFYKNAVSLADTQSEMVERLSASLTKALRVLKDRSDQTLYTIETHNGQIDAELANLLATLSDISKHKDNALVGAERQADLFRGLLEERDIALAKSQEKASFLEKLLEIRSAEVSRLNRLSKMSGSQLPGSFTSGSLRSHEYHDVSRSQKKAGLFGRLRLGLNVFRQRVGLSLPRVDPSEIKSFSDLTNYLVLETSKGASARAIAQVLRRVARDMLPIDTKMAALIGEAAVSLHRDFEVDMWWSALLFDCGRVTDASETLSLLPYRDKRLSPERRRKVELIRYSLLFKTINLPFVDPLTVYHPQACRLVYVAARALPERQTGYTLRTHELLKAYQQCGWKVTCISFCDSPEPPKASLAAGRTTSLWLSKGSSIRCFVPPNLKRLL